MQHEWSSRTLEMSALLLPCPSVVTRVRSDLLQHMSSPVLSPVLASELLHLPRKDIDELSMPMTHMEWRGDSRHESTAPLKLVKTRPGKSRYLYETVTGSPLTAMLARLRHNRVYTQQARHRFEDKSISPRCTFSTCARRELARVPLDDVPHILVACDRHAVSRRRLICALHEIDPAHFSESVLPLAVALGNLYHTPELARSPKCQQAYVAVREYFYHITIERGADDPGLRLLFG